MRVMNTFCTFKSLFILFVFFLCLFHLIYCENNEDKNDDEDITKKQEELELSEKLEEPEILEEPEKPEVPMIKVSIIIPVYNSAEFIERSLGCALNQTLKEIEVIVINDCSTDDTLEIVKKYETDPRLKIISLNQNHGAGIARNLGLELASGEFVGFIDSDDYADERFFEFLYKYSKDKDLVNGIFVFSTSLSDKFKHHGKYGVYGGTYDSIWRREFINKYHIRYGVDRRVGEDIIFRSSFMEKKPRVAKVPDKGIYYYYKRREGSLMNFDLDYLKEEDDSYREGGDRMEVMIYSILEFVMYIGLSFFILFVVIQLFIYLYKKSKYEKVIIISEV